SREIQQSNKAPRHHNDNFESDKRFIETVAELRLEIYPIKSHDENYECDAAYISLLKNSASRQIQ
ncbi:MAG: hypothetical protein E6641_15555, partial [Bacteroides faecis]|nr:hypothetical protein [Bacteroides faecis]